MRGVIGLLQVGAAHPGYPSQVTKKTSSGQVRQSCKRNGGRKKEKIIRALDVAMHVLRARAVKSSGEPIRPYVTVPTNPGWAETPQPHRPRAHLHIDLGQTAPSTAHIPSSYCQLCAT